jgi:hypothetical protein
VENRVFNRPLFVSDYKLRTFDEVRLKILKFAIFYPPDAFLLKKIEKKSIF